MDPSVAPRTPAADARWEVALTVAASASFHRSPRLRELLLYICERAVQNRPADLREQQIGCAVFGRKPDYNPGEDNIVRVEIRQLRKRLEEYFATEGKNEPFVIVIPKGAYVPMFELRASEPAARIVPAVETPKIKQKPWLIWLQPVAIAFLAAVCVWLWVTRQPGSRVAEAVATRPAVERGPLWPLLFNNRHETFIVCADSSLVTAQQVLGRPISLEEYLSGEYTTKSATVSADSSNLLRLLRIWQFTDIADVRLVQKLSILNAQYWDKVMVRSARTAQLQDFKTGNSILLGSSRSNLWNKLFDPLLNFVFDYDGKQETAFIRNKAPAQGEAPEYRHSKSLSGEAYSILALVPNLRHTGSVLIIAGTSGESTEATGEFIMNTDSSASLMKMLADRNKGRLPYFELLLRSRTLEGIAKNPEIAAVRLLGDDFPPN